MHGWEACKYDRWSLLCWVHPFMSNFTPIFGDIWSLAYLFLVHMYSVDGIFLHHVLKRYISYDYVVSHRWHMRGWEDDNMFVICFWIGSTKSKITCDDIVNDIWSSSYDLLKHIFQLCFKKLDIFTRCSNVPCLDPPSWSLGTSRITSFFVRK